MDPLCLEARPDQLETRLEGTSEIQRNQWLHRWICQRAKPVQKLVDAPDLAAHDAGEVVPENAVPTLDGQHLREGLQGNKGITHLMDEARGHGLDGREPFSAAPFALELL